MLEKIQQAHQAFYDVLQYPPQYMHLDKGAVNLCVTYMQSWNDGFGARGWKLDASIGDPHIIASTRETGQRINTSVFIHDILDHYLSGFGISGHRSEAMALIQLSNRTGSDPTPDYLQMIHEDILNGHISGEALLTFLPHSLITLLPEYNEFSNRETMTFIMNKLGKEKLVSQLLLHFFKLGKTGEKHANKNRIKLGIQDLNLTVIGNNLQKLLQTIDTQVEVSEVDFLKGIISIKSNEISFNPKTITKPGLSHVVA